MLSHENKNYDCAGLMRHITKPDFYQYVFESLVNNIPAAKAALFYFCKIVTINNYINNHENGI